jgi:hypothetical protein
MVILDRLYGTRMIADLSNPVVGTALEAAGLFRRAGPGAVRYTPEIALGLEVPIRGGYYTRERPAGKPARRELWTYQHRSTSKRLENGDDLTPPLAAGSVVEFDPGDAAFGLYVANDQFQDAVFSEPAAVALANPRLAAQPYKAMIYPYKDRATGKAVANSYLVCWEYSTNDDFQDAVCRVDNVVLLAPARR